MMRSWSVTTTGHAGRGTCGNWGRQWTDAQWKTSIPSASSRRLSGSQRDASALNLYGSRRPTLRQRIFIGSHSGRGSRGPPYANIWTFRACRARPISNCAVYSPIPVLRMSPERPHASIPTRISALAQGADDVMHVVASNQTGLALEGHLIGVRINSVHEPGPRESRGARSGANSQCLQLVF